MNKKLTIITINYNNLKGLKKTFDSVFSQTYKDFEYIVIDGGSTDGSKDYIEANQDKIDYWISEKDKGVYHAMNKGILKANGEYLNFMNSGDVFFDNFTLNKFNKQNFYEDLIYGNAKFLNNNNKITDFLTPNELTFYYFYTTSLCHQATFIKKKLFIDYELYNEENKIVSDWEFFLKMIFLYNISVKQFNEFICIYDFDGISSRPENAVINQKERDGVLNKYFSRILPDYLKLHYFINENINSIFNLLRNNNNLKWKIIKFIIKNKLFPKILSIFIFNFIHQVFKPNF